MNYWQRWIGDWKRKTAHLSAEAKGIYGELLDHQYATHKALPADKEDCYRIAGARTQSECRTTDKVLGEFFKLTDEGYINERAFEEITSRREYIEGQRERANRRWQHEEEQPPQKINGERLELPAWLDADKWKAWIKIRPARARTHDAQAAAIKKLSAFKESGLDPNAIVETSIANGWQGLFPPDKAKPGRMSLAEANKAAGEEALRRFNEDHGIK